MTQPRKPAVFRLEPEHQPDDERTESKRSAEARKPRAVKADIAVVTPAEIDVFDNAEHDTDIPPPIPVKPRRAGWASLFVGALGVLISLAIGLWTDSLIRTLFERAEWLGWLALGVATLAALARLASVEKLRAQAEDALW